MPTNKTTRPWCYWEESRQMWRAQELMPDGKYHNIRAQTQKELRAKIDATRADIQRQIDAAANAVNNPTFRACEEKWIALQKTKLKQRSASVLSDTARLYVDPILANKRIGDIKPADIDDMLIAMQDRSKSVQSKALRIARRIFDYAIENEYIVKNPCDRKKAGGDGPSEKEPLTDEQADRLLEALNTKRTKRAYLFCAIALFTGLRREEILGLSWEDIHFEQPTAYLSVTHAVIFEKPHSVRTDDLKSTAAYRNIPLPPQFAELLRDEKAVSESPLVFAMGDGNILSLTAFNNLWGSVKRRFVDSPKGNREIAKRTIDFYVTPHILRHTYISNLCRHSAETGLDIKKIQYLAGHSDPETTMRIYAHVMENRPEDMAHKIEMIFSRPIPRPKTNLKNGSTKTEHFETVSIVNSHN